ncbi:MAG: hypothetical protein QXT97_04725 [Candidatus Diapherotrites archaeon]
MDTFTFLLTILFMFMAIQFGQTWIVLGILVISIISSKEFSTIVALLISTIVLYFIFFSGNSDNFWVPAMFGLIILAILLGNKPEEQSPSGGFDMFGGYGGYGGLGSIG